jgi:hypothetical protein
VGRPSGTRVKHREISSSLRSELQRKIESGQCAYCRTPAHPDKPLTREHVIPRSRGGRRRDIRIIVPACARCNHHRGCRELIPFLLTRPHRISCFLDYLGTLSPESLRELDLRIFAELYAALAILRECAARGGQWRGELDRLCGGRALHRKRYAARRAIGSLGERAEGLRGDGPASGGPTCLIPAPRANVLTLHLEEPLERMACRLISTLAVLWHLSADLVERELQRELAGSLAAQDEFARISALGSAEGEDNIVPLDGWKRRRKRRRVRVDRRQGRVRTGRTGTAKGRAA